MTYRIAICDDEQSQIEYLTSVVSAWSNKSSHICEVHSFPSAEAFLFAYEDDKAYDILLLDVEMRSITGIELAKRIRRENEAVQIIFITGYADYISEGYEVDALHYLMKPVSSEKLCTVLDKATYNLDKAEKHIRITYDRQMDFVPLSQITHIEAQKQYVLIQTLTKTYRMKCSLSDMETQLDEYFYKCQRSFIVNLRYVTRISGDHVTLKTGTDVPISRGMAEKIGKEIIRLF